MNSYLKVEYKNNIININELGNGVIVNYYYLVVSDFHWDARRFIESANYFTVIVIFFCFLSKWIDFLQFRVNGKSPSNQQTPPSPTTEFINLKKNTIYLLKIISILLSNTNGSLMIRREKISLFKNERWVVRIFTRVKNYFEKLHA